MQHIQGDKLLSKDMIKSQYTLITPFVDIKGCLVVREKKKGGKKNKTVRER